MPLPLNPAQRSKSTVSLSQSDKVDFLSKPGSYLERTENVSVIQTHHAWVFLTDKHAYKMKKPTRYGHYDYSSLESRHHLCTEEDRLNRRLAGQTYIGISKLVIGRNRQLALDADGTVVEWLVKMRRLPQEQLLDVAAENDRVHRDDIDRLMNKLLRFYRKAPVCGFAGLTYTSRLQIKITSGGHELMKPEFRFPLVKVREIIDQQKDYVSTQSKLLETRQRDGRIREVHGDLRPEHICLLPNAEPEIIDCLEFDPDLRCLDCVEELAFFGMECRMIGQQWIEEQTVARYRSHSGDPVPMHLWHFYAARRATIRAKLCARHALDCEEINDWLQRGRDYLNLAEHYLSSTSSL